MKKINLREYTKLINFNKMILNNKFKEYSYLYYQWGLLKNDPSPYTYTVNEESGKVYYK